MVVMFVAGLYNITDAIFVGLATGEQGLAACLVTFPMYCVMYGLAELVAMGGSILISQFRGQKNDTEVNRVFSQMVLLGIVVGVLIPVLLIPICPELMRFSGATEELVDDAVSYMSVILYTSLLPVLWFSFCAVIRNDDHPHLAMSMVCTGVVLNIFFDWLFLMKFHWGIPGAAWATVVSEVPTLILSMVYFASRWTKIRFHGRYLFPQKALLWRIVKNGIPSFGSQSSVGVMLLFHNWQALRYGQAAGLGTGGLAAYSVICSTSSLASM
ncbi:MAG: MATE family efflux transporter, partial [Planctomycetia bacterium]|nr:MATE family efflux transporter [Planctomycetia bacterium]